MRISDRKALSAALALVASAFPFPSSAFVPITNCNNNAVLVGVGGAAGRRGGVGVGIGVGVGVCPSACAASSQRRHKSHRLLHSPSIATSATRASVSAAPYSMALSASSVEKAEAEAEAEAEAAVAGRAKSTASSPPDMAAYSRGYKTVFIERPCQVHDASSVIGTLPPDLKGTYYRSGPAMFSAGSLPPPPTSLIKPKTDPVPDGTDPARMVRHPFEGDGAVLAVTFPGGGSDENGEDNGSGGGGDGGGACSRFRYVRTNAFTNERKKGGKMYDAMESTRSGLGCDVANDLPLPAFRHHLQPGLNRKRKNTSNTRTVYWSKKLLTLWEGGLPYKLDALALSTEGRSQLGGVLKEADPFGAGCASDPTRKRLLLYSCRQDSGRSDLRLYEFNSKFRLVQEKGGIVEEEIPGFALLSDLSATENYAVFVQPAVAVNGMQFLVNKDPGRCLELKNGGVGPGALMHLIPRVSSKKAKKTLQIPADGFSNADVQFCNSYELDDGKKVAIDAIRSDPSLLSGKPLPWPWATTASEYTRTASRKSLWRYTVDITSGSVRTERLSNIQAQFGVINPDFSGREHRFVYAAVGGPVDSDATPPQGIGKFDVRREGGNAPADVWMPEPHQFCGEPMYAPRTGRASSSSSSDGGVVVAEDDGYILTVMYDGKEDESSVIVLKASSIAAGPVARVPLGMVTPHGLHGCFASSTEAAWDPEEVRRRAKLADKMEGRGSMWNEVKSDFSGLGLRLDDIEEYFGDVI